MCHSRPESSPDSRPFKMIGLLSHPCVLGCTSRMPSASPSRISARQRPGATALERRQQGNELRWTFSSGRRFVAETKDQPGPQCARRTGRRGRATSCIISSIFSDVHADVSFGFWELARSTIIICQAYAGRSRAERVGKERMVIERGCDSQEAEQASGAARKRTPKLPISPKTSRLREAASETAALDGVVDRRRLLAARRSRLAWLLCETATTSARMVVPLAGLMQDSWCAACRPRPRIQATSV